MERRFVDSEGQKSEPFSAPLHAIVPLGGTSSPTHTDDDDDEEEDEDEGERSEAMDSGAAAAASFDQDYEDFAPVALSVRLGCNSRPDFNSQMTTVPYRND